MKKTIIILLSSIFLILQSTIVLATDTVIWTPKIEVEVDKEWKISFSRVVDSDTLNGNIMLIDDYGNTVETDVSLDKSGKTIQVKPINRYNYLSRYKLLISKEIKSRDTGEELKKDIEMEFITEKSIKDRVIGTWNTSYNGVNAIARFNIDNTASVDLGQVKLEGTYSAKDDTMIMDIAKMKQVGKVIFYGNDMFTVTNSNGNMMVFDRR